MQCEGYAVWRICLRTSMAIQAGCPAPISPIVRGMAGMETAYSICSVCNIDDAAWCQSGMEQIPSHPESIVRVVTHWAIPLLWLRHIFLFVCLHSETVMEDPKGIVIPNISRIDVISQSVHPTKGFAKGNGMTYSMGKLLLLLCKISGKVGSFYFFEQSNFGFVQQIRAKWRHHIHMMWRQRQYLRESAPWKPSK